MKGVYLNEIPVDLFMEYFNYTDLDNKYLEPVIQDFKAPLYTYKFSDTGIDYTIDLHYDSLDTIKNLFLPLFGLNEVPSNSDIIGPTLDSFQLYYNSDLNLVYPYQYYFRSNNGETYYGINIANLEETTLENMLLQTDKTIYSPIEIDKTAYFDENKKYFIVRDSNETELGRIYENSKYQIQETDNEGRPLYINDLGEETIKNFQKDLITPHNKFMRTLYPYFSDPIDYISIKFNPSCIGLVNILEEKNEANLFEENLQLAYFERYKLTETYTKLLELEEEIDNLEVIDPIIINKLNSTNPFSIETENFFVNKNILNISKLDRIKVINSESLSFTFSMLENSKVSLPKGQPALLDLYDYKIKFLGKEYPLDTSTKKITITGLGDLDVVINNNTAFVRLPVAVSEVSDIVDMGPFGDILNMKQYIVKIPKLTSGLETKTKISLSSLENLVSFVINSKFYFLKRLTSLDQAVYSDGYYLSVDAELSENYIKTFFGVVNNSSTFSNIILDKYSVPSYDPLAEEIDVVETYHKDILTNTIVKKEVSYTRENPSDLPYDISEFLDYTHSFGDSEDKNFDIDDPATGNTKYVKRGAAISTPLELETFKNNFALFSHYYYRGDLVGHNLFRAQYLNMLGNMTQEFMEKQYDNFLIIDNAIFDSNAPLKMRLTAEGYKRLIENNTNALLLAKRSRKEQYEITELEKKLVVEAPRTSTIGIKIKDYSANTSNLITRSSANTFQRLKNYKKFASKKEEELFLANKELRETIYADSNNSRVAKDEINLYTKEYRYNKSKKIDFKNILLNDLVENFYTFNDYFYNSTTGKYVNDNFISNYTTFYKKKLDFLQRFDNFSNDIFSSDNKILEKQTYYAGEDSEKDTELFSKIFLEDWRVL